MNMYVYRVAEKQDSGSPGEPGEPFEGYCQVNRFGA